MLSHFQQETKCNQALQMKTKKLQIQKGTEQLLKEVKMLDWKDAEDSKIQEAMGNIASWKGRKLKIGEYFQDFEGWQVLELGVGVWKPHD